VITAEELRGLLAAPAESTTLDFKERVEWASRHAKLELVRDIVCLANRNGGMLVLGVADVGGGRFEARGLGVGDQLPDVTELAQLAANHFDPPPIIQAAEIEVDGRRYGVIQAQEFRRTPHVCRTIGQDGAGIEVFRPVDLFRRTDALQCARISTSDGLTALIESAMVKSGILARSLLPESPPPGREAPDAIPSRLDALGLDAAVRACDLRPLGDAPRHAVADLPGLVANATIRSAGGVLVPRSIRVQEMSPSEVVREPHRILVETSRGAWGTPPETITSVIEVTISLRVRIRERLWEDENKVDFTSLVAHVLACLAFAERFFGAAGVERFSISVGLISPLGLVLSAMGRFTPFMQTYIATSTTDLMVERELEVAAIATPDQRAEIGRGMVAELAWYFGYTLSDAAWEAQLTETRRNVEGT
jgi:hypothetical protein